MMRARLFADDRKTVEVEETEEQITVRIHSLVEALRLSGVALAARRYGKQKEGGEDSEGPGKPVVVRYGPLKFSL